MYNDCGCGCRPRKRKCKKRCLGPIRKLFLRPNCCDMGIKCLPSELRLIELLESRPIRFSPRNGFAQVGCDCVCPPGQQCIIIPGGCMCI